MKKPKRQYLETLKNHLQFLNYSERDIKLIETCLVEGLNLEEFDEDKFDINQWRKENNQFFDERI